MKTPMTLILGVALATALAQAKEPGSDGTRGGAETMIHEGIERLRDLVDPAVCEDRTGIELRKEYPQIDQVLSRVAQLDWYLAAALRWEINHLQFCFTDTLVRLPRRRDGSVIVEKSWLLNQAAIRFVGTFDVYANSRRFTAIPPLDRAFFVIHEAMHTYIPLESPMRKENLAAAVKALFKVANGEIRTAGRLHTVLERHFVSFPWVSERIGRARPAVDFALGAPADQRATLLAAPDLNALLTPELDRIQSLVRPEHLSDLSKGASAQLSELLATDGSDYAVLDKLLNPPAASPKLTAIDPILVAFSVPAVEYDLEYRARVLNSSAMKEGLTLFARMKNKALGIAHFRIVAKGGFPLLGIIDPSVVLTPAQEVPALAVRPLSLEESERIPSETQGLIRFLAQQTRMGEDGWSVIRHLVTQNDAFYAAFGIQEVAAQLETLDAPVRREKDALRQALPELIRGFRRVLIETTRSAAGDPAAARLDQEINWSRLGLIESK